MALQPISIPDLADWLFTQPPMNPCTYNLFTNSKSENLFPVLMALLIEGAKRLYGNDITPAKMSYKQFEHLKQYFLSIGYQVKHNYTDKEDTTLINIWFEKVNYTEDCKGLRILNKVTS